MPQRRRFCPRNQQVLITTNTVNGMSAGLAKAGFDGGWVWRVVLPDAGGAGEARGGSGASETSPLEVHQCGQTPGAL